MRLKCTHADAGLRNIDEDALPGGHRALAQLDAAESFTYGMCCYRLLTRGVGILYNNIRYTPRKVGQIPRNVRSVVNIQTKANEKTRTKSLKDEALHHDLVFAREGLRLRRQSLHVHGLLRVEVEVDDVHHRYMSTRSAALQFEMRGDAVRTLRQFNSRPHQEGQDHVALRLGFQAKLVQTRRKLGLPGLLGL